MCHAMTSDFSASFGPRLHREGRWPMHLRCSHSISHSQPNMIIFVLPGYQSHTYPVHDLTVIFESPHEENALSPLLIVMPLALSFVLIRATFLLNFLNPAEPLPKLLLLFRASLASCRSFSVYSSQKTLLMYKALYWAEKQQQSPNMGYIPKIEEAYNALSNEEKKKFDTLSEELFRENYLNAEKSKAQLKRLECHECHASHAKEKDTAANRDGTTEFNWSENALKVAFIAAPFYAAHTIARDPFSFLTTIYVLLWLYGKVFE